MRVDRAILKHGVRHSSMWILLWGLVLFLVHIQFQHCAQITTTCLKIIETSLIVGMIRLMYVAPEHIELLWNISKTRLEL